MLYTLQYGTTYGGKKKKKKKSKGFARTLTLLVGAQALLKRVVPSTFTALTLEP